MSSASLPTPQRLLDRRQEGPDRERTGDPERARPVRAHPAPPTWRPGQSAAPGRGRPPAPAARPAPREGTPPGAGSGFLPPRHTQVARSLPSASPLPDSSGSSGRLPGSRPEDSPGRGRGRAAAPPAACPSPVVTGPVLSVQASASQRTTQVSHPLAPHPSAHLEGNTWAPALSAGLIRPGDPHDAMGRWDLIPG